MTFLDYFLPSFGQFGNLLAVLVTLTVFALLGAAACPGKRFAAVDVFAGWGIANMAFLLGGVFGHIPFTWIAAGLWGAALPSAFLIWRRRRNEDVIPGAAHVVWRILALSLPLLLLVASMKASQWDEFSQWLPNSQYIFRHDGFPGGDMPVSPSVYPAYPYGLPLITYLSSKLSGGFIENAGAMANVLLLLLLGPVYLAVVRRGLQKPEDWTRSWGAAALGVLGVTLFSTMFVQKIFLTTYADGATAVVLAAAGALAWKIIEALASKTDGERERAKSLAWQFAWAAAALLNIKQPNLALLGLVLGGMGLVALRDPKIRFLALLRLLPVMLLPGIIAYLSWRYHVKTYLAHGEFNFLPVDNWMTSEAFFILKKMLITISKKGAYLGMMTVISLTSLYALWRYKGGFARFGIIAGTVFVGYNFFLWILYITAFGSSNALTVTSLWRFNIQLGLIGCVAAAYGAAILWRLRVSPRLGKDHVLYRLLPVLGVALVLTAPVAAKNKLRFDIRPQKDHMRMVGQDLARTLPEGSRLAIIDPRGVGLTDQIINYELTSGPGAGRNLKTLYRFTVVNRPKAELLEALEKQSVTHAWAFEPLESVQKALGVTLKPSASHLLGYAGGGEWKLLRSWPYDGYDDPYSLPK
ncbi:MAG TPA: hypothetical protein ENI79_04965 [Rhodospirillales bacterium]|nr:hypothetical protein [Rhodospirillales bacterium]